MCSPPVVIYIIVNSKRRLIFLIFLFKGKKIVLDYISQLCVCLSVLCLCILECVYERIAYSHLYVYKWQVRKYSAHVA